MKYPYGTPAINEGITARVLKRNETYNRIEVDQFPVVYHIHEPAFIGTYSWLLPKSKQRWARRDMLRHGFGLPETPTTLARDYLNIKYPEPLRAFHHQYVAINRPRSFPFFSKPGNYEDMVYMDLKAAFWSITNAVGWNVEYMPNGFLGKRSSMTDFPLVTDKLARNALVSAGLGGGARFWTGSTMKESSGRNKLINMGLWAVVMDVLHGIAADMKLIGAVYIHTDGYIVPRSKANTAVAIAQSWGIPCRQKLEGDAIVKGVGQYKIGSHSSILHSMREPTMNENVNPIHPKWLKKEFNFWSERTGQFYGHGEWLNTVNYEQWLTRDR